MADPTGAIPKRKFGKAHFMVSCIGFGGHHIGDALDVKTAKDRLPVGTTISGMESMEALEQNLAIASGFQPMSAQEMQSLRDRVKFWASDGRFDRFKTTKMYDGAEGRKQHEYPPVSELPAWRV